MGAPQRHASHCNHEFKLHLGRYYYKCMIVLPFRPESGFEGLSGSGNTRYHTVGSNFYTHNITTMIDIRRKILSDTHIDWDRHHKLSAHILDLLPHTKLSHPNIAKLLDLSELKDNIHSSTYFLKGAYIYGIFHFMSKQSCTYIGQTGMQRRKRLDRNKLWQDLEHAPLQRMREHIQTAIDLKHTHKAYDNKSKSTTLYNHMKYDPAAWIMIPLAYIDYPNRSQAKQIEDRWWSSFFPNTYNDQPPNGTLISNMCTNALERQIISKINKMGIDKFIKTLSSPKVRLSVLECIAGLNRLDKFLSKHHKSLLLSIIKRKARSSNLSNLRLSWNFIIPLQTKSKLSLIKNSVATLIKRLNCLMMIKTFIQSHIHVYFRPTKRIVNLIRMDRDHTDKCTYNDIKDPLTPEDTSDSGCNCHKTPTLAANKLAHTFIRTDNKMDLDALITHIPELDQYKDILTSSPQDRVHLNHSKSTLETKYALSNLLKSLPGSKGQGKSFCRSIWQLIK